MSNIENLVKETFGEVLKSTEKEKKELQLKRELEKKEQIKSIIKKTLEKKVKLESEVKERQKEIKILNKDLEDFKNGRLDLIQERQKVDDFAKKTSVVEIIRIIEKYYEKPWYEPFKIIPPCYPITPSPIYPGPIRDPNAQWVDSNNVTECNGSDTIFLTGSDFHNSFAGTYDIDGNIFNF